MLNEILERYPIGVQPDRRGEYHVDCPFCGKEAKRGQIHFSFSERGYKCFICGVKGGLKELAAHLRIDTPVSYVRPAPKPTKPIAAWRTESIDHYFDHPQRFQAWSKYKPVTRETIIKYSFGYGRLPFQRADGSWYRGDMDWLIVPLYEDGALVGLRGRNTGDLGPKWISASGSAYVLWGLDGVQPGDIVWLCENYVDAAWLMQQHPEYKAVALGGATTWKTEWGALLAAQRPRQVIVALDNDMAGQATGEMLKILQEEWRAAHPGLAIPLPNGPRVANDLLAQGVNTLLFSWPADAPAKAGIDWILKTE